jgi:hypothetical protein
VSFHLSDDIVDEQDFPAKYATRHVTFGGAFMILVLQGIHPFNPHSEGSQTRDHIRNTFLINVGRRVRRVTDNQGVGFLMVKLTA